MQWWTEFQSWLSTPDGAQAVFIGIVIVIALSAGALLAAWVSGFTVRRMLKRRDEELTNSAIATLIDAATEASVFSTLSPQEQGLCNRMIGLADIQVRMLPLKGAVAVADWAAVRLGDIKRNSATYGYQIEPAVADFRDRLVDWRFRPAKAKKAFETELETWRLASDEAERRLLAEQAAWAAEHEPFSMPTTPQPTKPLLPPSRTEQLVTAVNALDQRRAQVAERPRQESNLRQKD